MWQFLKAGGVFMIPLVITSIVGVAFIIERGLALRWRKVIPQPLEDAVTNFNNPEETTDLRNTCQAQPSTLARLIMVVLNQSSRPREEVVDALQTRARHEMLGLERGLVVLEIVVGIAPLLGLVGAIYGLITLFTGLGQGGALDNALLAKGIGEALNTTLIGLLIAIPSLIAWSYYNKKAESLAIEMETICDELLRRMYRTKKQR